MRNSGDGKGHLEIIGWHTTPCAVDAAGVAVRFFARVLTMYQFANIQQTHFDLE